MPEIKSVCMLTTSFPLYEGVAAATFIKEQCRYLVESGIDVTVVVPHHIKTLRQQKLDGISVKRFRYFLPAKLQKLCYGTGIPTNMKNSRLARFQLPFFMTAFFFAALRHCFGKQIIHCHWSLAAVVGIIVGKLLHKPVVLTMYGAEVFVLGNHPLIRFVLKHVDQVISISSYTASQTETVTIPKRHRVIPPTIDIHRFVPTPDPEFRHRLNIADDTFIVLAVSRLIERKGMIYLVQAIEKLVKKDCNVHLLIGGNGPQREILEHYVKQESLQNHVTFLGFIPDNNIPTYYTESDVFVLPSIIDDRGDTEGLGLVILEANACETPAIASRVGGIVDVISEGENGLFVEQKDVDGLAQQIETLIDNPDLAHRLGKDGRELVKRDFNWNTIINKMRETYVSLLTSPADKA